jgi:hypothetical protein
VYSPGADQVAISTNGTGRLFIDSAGTIGIGAQGEASLSADTKQIKVGGLSYFRGTNGTSGKQNFYCGISYNAAPTSFNGDKAIVSNESSDYLPAQYAMFQGVHVWRTATAATAGSAITWNERMRLTNAGNLGLGTSSPGYQLEVSSGATDATALFNSTSVNGSHIRFGRSGTVDGYLGCSEGFLNALTPGDIAIRSQGALGLATGGANTRLYISSTGAVGIGTTAAHSRLYIQDSNTGEQLTIRSTSGNAGVAGLRFNIADNTVTTDLYSKASILFVGSNTGNARGSLTFNINNASDSTNVSTSNERMRLDGDGRLLVGTSSARTNYPSSYGTAPNFQLEGTTADGGMLAIFRNSTSATAAAYLALGRSKGSSLGSNTVVASGDRLAAISFNGTDGTNVITGATVEAYVDGTPGANDMPGRLVFSTTADEESSPTERMRIDNAGKVGIGRSPTDVLDVYRSSGQVNVKCDSDSLSNSETSAFVANGGARQAAIGVFKHASITNPCAYLELRPEDNNANYLWVDNSDQFRISSDAQHIGTTNGTVVGTQTSDERIKNILGPVEYGLETLNQIETVRYSLKSEPETEKLGFIAQQVQPLVPQSVFDTGEHIEGEPEDAPTKLGMEYVALIPVLVNAIKELSAEVDALKAQLEAS